MKAMPSPPSPRSAEAIARQALALIKVDYKVLPHVIDVAEAMKPDAPVLHDHLLTEGAKPPATKPSNIAKRIEFNKGDIAAGFAKAEVVIERDYTTQAVHQGYIEPHATLASASEDGQVQVWSTTQGHFQVRGFCSRLLDIETSQIRVTPTEIGGGFGGKTVVYLEPLAIRLSQKSGKPVKMTMSREEVFRASGPAPGGNVKVKIGAMKDGRIVAAECTVEMQAGAFPGSPVGPACMCSFACYDIDNVHIVGFDVVSNRPKVAAYRAPGAPISAWAVESTVDILRQQLKMDPIDLRLKNAATKGTKTAYGVTFNTIGMVETLQAAKNSPHYKTPVKPGYRTRRRRRLLVQRRRRFERGQPRRRGRLGDGDLGQSRHRRQPRVARPDGGRGAGRRLRQGAAGDRRYRLDRLQLRDRRQPRHLRHRPGGGELGARHDPRAEGARRQDLEGRSRRRDLGERHGQARRRQRRHVRAAHHRPARRHGGHGPAGRSTATPSSTSRAPARASACTVVDLAVDARHRHASPSAATRRRRMSARPSIRPTSRASSRAARCRASAGR